MLVISVDSFVVNSSSGIYLVLVFFLSEEARVATLLFVVFSDEDEQGRRREGIFEIIRYSTLDNYSIIDRNGDNLIV